MGFEFDPQKNKKNKEKHGIDFVEAQKLWEDPYRVEIPARYVDEPRYLLIGRIKEKYWSAIFTYRSDKIRIISVRRARKNEKEIYNS
ncbi:BrnT family toxin [Desulfothermus sp.]